MKVSRKPRIVPVNGEPHKYFAVKTDCNACGKVHPSKKEARRCGELHLLAKAGEIADLRTQAAFPLFGPSGVPLLSEGSDGKNKRQLRMTWDFAYTAREGDTVEDSKGFKTPEFKLRLSVFRACYPELRVVLS
jgi:hypothetical protein